MRSAMAMTMTPSKTEASRRMLAGSAMTKSTAMSSKHSEKDAIANNFMKLLGKAGGSRMTSKKSALSPGPENDKGPRSRPAS